MRRLVLMISMIILISSCGGSIYKQHIDQAIKFCSDKEGLGYIKRTEVLFLDVCEAYCVDGERLNIQGSCS